MEDPRLPRDREGDRGQATPLMAAVVVFAGLLALGAARLGHAAAEMARARTAADAAALAGATGDRAGAVEVATENGGIVEHFRQVGTDVVVTVRVGRSAATARARPRSPVVAGVEVVDGMALPVPRSAVTASAWSRPHHDYPALDLPVPVGTTVAALAGGQSRWVTDGTCGVGLSIQVAPGVRYVYCHGSARTVADGATVRAGQAVFRSGNTGHSTGPHLHVGVFVEGRSVCPQPLFAAVLSGRLPPAWQALPTNGCSG